MRNQPNVRTKLLILAVASLTLTALAGCHSSKHTGGGPAAEKTAPTSHPERLSVLENECRDLHTEIPWVSPVEFVELDDGTDWVVLDIRSEREREVSAIPGALNVWEFEADRNLYRDRKVLVYCTVGCRSGTHAEKLRRRGIEAYNLGGGVLAWAAAGQRFVTPDGADTHRVHVYASRWNALPEGYEPVW